MKTSTLKLYNWATHKASSDRSTLWLSLLFFLEIILLIPLDAVLMFFCLQKRRNILLYILLATIASTLSGLMGYLLGHFLWDLVGNWVVPHLISPTSFAHLSGHLQTYEHWAIFFGGLLPFPLKALSIAAGVFQLGILPFAIYLALSRFLRFSLIGLTMALWGEPVKAFIDRHFHKLFLLLGAKVAAALTLFWVLAR